MEARGVIRRIDELGRIVIPKEVRKQFGMEVGDPLEIIPTNEGVIIRTYPKAGSVLSYTKNLKDAICAQDWLKEGNQEELVDIVETLEARAIELAGGERK